MGELRSHWGDASTTAIRKLLSLWFCRPLVYGGLKAYLANTSLSGVPSGFSGRMAGLSALEPSPGGIW